MKAIRPLIFATAVLLILKTLPAEASLYQTSDPQFGANSITVDTSTGLGWLQLSKTVGLSYDQVLSDTQPGGLFSGYRFATEQEVMTLYASAGIPGPGYYPLSSPQIQSLISMLGPTWSQFGHPALTGISGTTFTLPAGSFLEDPEIYAFGLNSTVVYLVTGPGYYLGGINPTFSGTGTGSWLVKEVPEPSETGIFVLSGALWVGFIHLQRKQRA